MKHPRNTFNEWLQELELVRTSANESRGLTQHSGEWDQVAVGGDSFSRANSLPLLFPPLVQMDTGALTAFSAFPTGRRKK